MILFTSQGRFYSLQEITFPLFVEIIARQHSWVTTFRQKWHVFVGGENFLHSRRWLIFICGDNFLHRRGLLVFVNGDNLFSLVEIDLIIVAWFVCFSWQQYYIYCRRWTSLFAYTSNWFINSMLTMDVYFT